MLVYVVVILLFVLGIFLATVTWKIYPYFLSKRDYYRNSSYEILKLRGGATISVFVMTIYFGTTIMKDTFKEKSSNNKIETVVHQEKSKKKKYKNKAENTSTDTINKLLPTRIEAPTNEIIESATTEISTDSIIN